ncbi:MAG: PqqD family peptide modification chaperone [Selenomonadaceae bacterium]|nr:PqqD family peptide modification chaperone [Selenomonadaceae bacterium]
MKLAPGISFHAFGEKVYLHSIDSQKDYIFDGIALDVLNYFRENPDGSVQDLCAHIAGIYAVDDLDELQRDIQEFVGELVSEKILHKGTPLNDNMWSNKIPMEVAEEFAREHKLFSLSFELTYRCVERCIHCYIDDAPKFCADNELTLDEYKKILTQAREMGCVSILFTGGEILLRKDLCDIVEFATSLGFIVNLYTTGVGLTDEIFERLCAAKVDGISVSLYSGIAAEHDKITGVKGSFEKTLKATLMFKSAGVNTFIKCVAMKQNFDSLKSLFELGRRLKLYVTVSPRIISGHESKCAADYALGDLELYKKFYELNKQYVPADLSAPRFSREQMLERASCGAGINSLSIDPFGGVRPCNTFHQTFGSVREDSLQNIWEQSRNWNLRNRRMREVTAKCADCRYLEYCTVCVADLINRNHGDFTECGEDLVKARAAAEVLE